MTQRGSVVVFVCLLAVVGCATQKDALTTIIRPAPELMAGIKRIRVRLTTPSGIAESSPEYNGSKTTDVNATHAGVAEVVKAALEAKGYEVVFVGDDPWTYGPHRPCLLADHVGAPPNDRLVDDPVAGPCVSRAGWRGTWIWMRDFGGALPPDEAFLEMATASVVEVITTYRTVPTSTEVGHVEDQNGNTIGTVFYDSTHTEERQRQEDFASATAQMFVSWSPEPVLDAQAWTLKTATLRPVVERVLSKIPSRPK